MRYDSDPQIVRRILTETEALLDSLDRSDLSKTGSRHLVDECVPFVSAILNTLDHFAKLHILNPLFSLSRFSAYHIEQKLLLVRENLFTIFSQLQFPSLSEQMEWHRDRFLHLRSFQDNEQLLVVLYEKLVQVLETYYVDRVRNLHFAALLNEVVGWMEHFETHGHHDIHAVILFAEKVARDKAIIEQRIEVVREICLLFQERSFLRQSNDSSLLQLSPHIALELSRVYSPYLLELYETLLEDMLIIAISARDYHAFQKYCHDNQIEIYEEYHEVIKEYLKDYIEVVAGDIASIFQTIKIATILVNAELTHKRYLDLNVATDVLGENLAKDIRILERAVQQLKHTYPELIAQYSKTLRKVKKFKGEIMKPAIKLYGEYLKNPEGFFQNLPDNQTQWIPILDSALACLEQHDELYQKCNQLKNQIDNILFMK